MRFLGVLTLNAQNNNQQKRIKHYNLEKDLAVQGFDVVTYFISGKPQKGNKYLSFQNNGVTYFFASKTNLELFKTNPAKYEPQYGGWCAYAMGNDGSKVEVDPLTFKITDGKLYLFYNFYFTNTLKKWNNDEAVLKKNANANWSRIITR